MRQIPENKVVYDSSDDAHSDGGPAPVNPLARFHDLMRGRYTLGVILLILGLSAGGAAGYFLTKPVYQSVGLILIKPSLPRVLDANEQNGVMPMFDDFVESQVALVQSQRVIDLAMQDPDWVALGRGLEPEAVAAFQNSITVERPTKSEMIQIEFQDHDPMAARVGAQALVDAYDRLYGDSDSDSVTASVRVLEERRSKLEADEKNWNDKIVNLASDVGGSKDLLDQMQQAKLVQLNEVETQLRQAQLALAIASDVPAPSSIVAGNTSDGSAAKAGTTRAVGMAPSTGPLALTNSPGAAEDPRFANVELQTLLTTSERLKMQMAANETELGEKHPTVVAEKDMLAKLNLQIEQAEADYPPPDANTLATSTSLVPSAEGKSIAQLKAEEKNVHLLYDQLRAETLDLSRKCVDAANYKAESDQCNAKLEETKQRIEQLDLESSVGGRVTIESKGDQPQIPFKDKRKQMAAAGALALGGAGFGLVALIGYRDRRVRGLSDVTIVAGRSERILGALPFLPDDLSDPEQAALAAQSVHQIRAMLEQGRAANHTVFAVTSASAGSGKTSLTLALGLSFAASGSRVLLIDCDIIGGGLSARMKQINRRFLGRILLRQKLVSVEQINHALLEARRTGELIGQALIRLNYVAAADVDQALETQKDTNVGLREAMEGEPAQNCVATTGVPGLYLMPLGTADHRQVGQLSYNVVRRILDQVREKFDVILIDTGPILGSLEASVTAMAADEVVLTVAQGEQRPMVERAKQQLAAAGGRLAGIVLNRAEVLDIVMSGFSSSVARMSSDTSKKAQLPYVPVENDRLSLGPLGTAVASLTDVSGRSLPPSGMGTPQ